MHENGTRTKRNENGSWQEKGNEASEEKRNKQDPSHHESGLFFPCWVGRIGSPDLFAPEPARDAALRLGRGVLDLLVQGINGLVHLRPRVLHLLGHVGRGVARAGGRAVVLALCPAQGRVELGAGVVGILFGVRARRLEIAWTWTG